MAAGGAHARARARELALRNRVRACCALLAGVGLMLGAGGTGGDAGAVETEASQRVTFFREPSAANVGVTVVHPQTDVNTTLGSAVNLAAGYAVDVVTGATPAIFGVDAVSSATKFSDARQQVRGAITYTQPVADVSVAYSYGWEHDYRSHSVTVATRSDVLDHTFTLGLSFTHNFDQVCDQNNANAVGRPLDRLALVKSEHCFQTDPGIVTHHLTIDSLEPSLTWAVTPRLLLQTGGTMQILDGFQANPYRRVQLGPAGRTPQESLPNFRQRFALFGRGGYAIPALRASFQGMVRLYRDTWAVQAYSAELSFQKYLAKFLLLTVRARIHSQLGASFYRDAQGYRELGPVGQYWTGDRELSTMQNTLVGGKLAYLRIPESPGMSFFNEVEVAAKFEGLFYNLASALAPNADRHHALIGQLALSLRF
jgi:hypothetical protein